MLTVLLSSPRVAPGLLTWQAWSALRAADRVLAGSGGHPLIPALTAADVVPAVVDAPPPSDAAALAAFLSSATLSPDEGSPAEGSSVARSSAGGARQVVWLAPPGEPPDPVFLSLLAAPHQVLHGSHDLPGAHLLDLVAIMDKLRVACPWDREQTHASLLRYLLEEAYEAAEAIENSDPGALREEIGDVMFQAFFHARIAAERPAADGGFTIDDVADTLAAKLIRRHPHVFGTTRVSSAADVNANWEEIKKTERVAKAALSGGSPDGATAPSALDGVPFGQPALSLAAQLQRRAQRAGISVHADGADTIGGALMDLVACAREAGLDPELELRSAARRFADAVRERERRTGAPELLGSAEE
ncbi:MAG TPA: MazG family protein [Trebonia sp.]